MGAQGWEKATAGIVCVCVCWGLDGIHLALLPCCVLVYDTLKHWALVLAEQIIFEPVWYHHSEDSL